MPNQYPKSTTAEMRRVTNKEHRLLRRVHENAYITNDDVIVSVCDGKSIPEHERIFADQIVGTDMGALFASYPNMPLKTVYESIARDESFAQNIPDYFYSCPAIDDMLFGHHPKTYYFDISRGGPVSVVRRSMGYVKLAQERHFNSKNPKMQSWTKTYGIGTCIPVITFDNLVAYTIDNSSKMYAVPATSVAESLMACATYFAGMRSDITRITHKDSWISASSQQRNKGSLRIYEALHRYVVRTCGQEFFNKLIVSGSNISEISRLYMKMAEQQFLLGSTREDICEVFAEIMFDPQSPRSHPNYGAQADCSELVVRGREMLEPIPWETIILFGDKYGTTFDQLNKIAKIIKKNLPKAVVVILVDTDGKPLKPNYDGDLIPNDSDYMTVAWTSYLLESKISRQKSQFILQQSATR